MNIQVQNVVGLYSTVCPVRLYTSDGLTMLYLKILNIGLEVTLFISTNNNMLVVGRC